MTKTPDLIVVGGGISGLAIAREAATDGHRVTVLEKSAQVGGCLHSPRTSDGYWFEMGAHTAYNSYGRFLDLAVAGGLKSAILPRGQARSRFGFLTDEQVEWTTPKRLLWKLNWLQAIARLPFALLRSKQGQSLGAHFSAMVGARNFQRVLSPFLAAVPSQCANGFPASGPGSLFKKRPRRQEYPRSFGFEGGLQSACLAASHADGMTVCCGVAVVAIRKNGAQFQVTTATGDGYESPRVAMAAPLGQARALLEPDFSRIAQSLGQIGSVSVDSVGVVLPRDRCWMPECAFVVPADDVFFSCVTRDVFPDAAQRAFTFHFRPGIPRERKLARMGAILRVGQSDLVDLVERTVTLPSPIVGHADTLAQIDQHLSGSPLAITGNYFDGLSIEDCMLRSHREWQRLKSVAADAPRCP